MPIVNKQAEPITELATGSIPDPEADASPSTGTIFGAAFRQNNLIGSAVTDAWNMGGIANYRDPNYSAWDDIKGTPYEEHWQAFATSNNRRYTEALKGQVDTEQRDRRTLDAGGWTGTLANLSAGVLDPTILIPVGGEAIKGAQGYRMLRTFGRTAAAGGVATTVQETGLQATQFERPLSESATNVGFGIVLSGILGSGAAALLSKPERDLAKKGFDNLVKVYAEPANSSAGAAQASKSLGVEALTIDGAGVGKIAEATQFLNPGLRLNHSPSGVARQVGQELAEGSVYQVGHAEGLTTGAAVERLAGMTERARTADGLSRLNSAYQDMRKAGVPMSFDDFDDAIGRAMRNEDVGENEFVSRAAKDMRSSIVDPFFEDGKTVGLYDDGDKVAFAPSYFPRQYRTKVLIAKEPEIKAQWIDYLKGHIQGRYAEAAESLRSRLADIDQQTADLTLSAEDRAKTLTGLEEAASKLEDQNPQHIERVQQISQLRREKPEGYRAEVERLNAEGGTDFAKFLQERGRLRGRIDRVDFGHSGLESRQARIAGSLEKLEDANQRSLQRLVRRGQGIQRLSDKLSPKKIGKEISSLRTAFAETLARSERAMDRTAKAAERLGEDAPAGMAARIEKEAKAQAKRHERLTRISDRLENAESLDPKGALQAARDAADELVQAVGDLHAQRSARISRLIDRQNALDPARVQNVIANIAARKEMTLRKFLDKWEIKHLGEGVDPLKPSAAPDFKDMARLIVDDVYDKLTGRDYGASSSVAPEYMIPIERGPVKERTLPIPDALLTDQGVLENRASEVLRRYSRTLAADVELTRKFGSPRLDDQLKSIADEYAKLREGVTEPKELRRLNDRQAADQRDIEALRDLIRGTYKREQNSNGWARVARAASHFNFMRSLGGVVVSSLSDIARPAMVHGLGRFMSEGIAPLLKNVEAVRLSTKEAKLAGTVVERVLQHRIQALSGMADPFERGTPVERAMEGMSRFAAKWTGMPIWNDSMKAISSVLSQNRILSGEADRRTLAFLGIDPATEDAIRAEFKAHGEVMDGVHVAHTEQWTNQDAIRAFRAAVGKDVDSTIITPGAADAPLLAHTPTGRLLLQFRSYTLAAHQKVLLRGLQEGKGKFVSGMVGMTSLGILSATLKAWRAGENRWEKFKHAAENPGYVIGEGMDNAGFFTLGFDASNTIEKLGEPMHFSFNPIKTPLMAAGTWANPNASTQGKSIRYSSRGPLGALLGPTAGLTEDIFQAGAGVSDKVRGKAVPRAEQNAAWRLMPFNSYYGMREAIQAVTGDSPYLQESAVPTVEKPAAVDDQGH